MDIRIEDISSTRKQAVFHFEPEELKTLELKSIDLTGQSRWRELKGFRKGKAPRELVRQRFSQEVEERMREQALKKSYEALNSKEGVSLYGIAKVDTEGLGLEASGILKVVFDVEPEIQTPDYKGLVFKEEAMEVSQQELDEAVQRMIRQHSEFVPVERAASKGDYVKCSYKGTFEGKPAQESFQVNPIYTHQQNTWEEVDPDQPIGVPELLKALVGMQKGDTATLKQAYAKNFEVEALRGKTLEYEVTVHEVREHKPPAMDEAFFKKIEVASLEDLRAQLKKGIEQRKTQQAHQARRTQVLDFLAQSKNFSLPQLAVEDEIEGCFSRIAHERMRNGANEEAIEAQKETIFKEAQQEAARLVKINFLLGDIAKAEKIEVTQEDLQRAAYEESVARRMEIKDFVSYIQKTPRALNRLKQNALLNKTLDFLANPAIVEAVN